MDREELKKFEEESGFRFCDKSILATAFVHRSYLNEVDTTGSLEDNERLEFLGDAFLGLVISELLYRTFPTYQEGELTRLRSRLVRRETLARVAEKLKLGEYLLLGRGEEESGGRTRPATLCATFEAVVGALYVDQGMEVTRRLILDMLRPELARISGQSLDKDAKSRLQEYIQSAFGHTPRYKTISAVGPDHDKRFTILALVARHPIGVGYGRSKQEAAQAAAAQALYRLGEAAPEHEEQPQLAPSIDLVSPDQLESLLESSRR